mmetsp:Transcript_14704/g.55659  ORF Transcript_14704/g.55659 Transcript_14704/m.55659 type:complete len:216 (+) Transcript_14704:1297-1944(+)
MRAFGRPLAFACRIRYVPVVRLAGRVGRDSWLLARGGAALRRLGMLRGLVGPILIAFLEGHRALLDPRGLKASHVKGGILSVFADLADEALHGVAQGHMDSTVHLDVAVEVNDANQRASRVRKRRPVRNEDEGASGPIRRACDTNNTISRGAFPPIVRAFRIFILELDPLVCLDSRFCPFADDVPQRQLRVPSSPDQQCGSELASGANLVQGING